MKPRSSHLTHPTNKLPAPRRDGHVLPSLTPGRARAPKSLAERWRLDTAFPLLLALALSPVVATAAAASELAIPRAPASDAELRSWLESMVWHHRFSMAEMMSATGLEPATISEAVYRFKIMPENRPQHTSKSSLLVLPYPGGRHPRRGFFDGAIDPQRETKISVFCPWDNQSYVVVDVPEAIWHQDGLLYLAHQHVPTLWTKQNLSLQPLEWNQRANGSLDIERLLPNQVRFGASVVPRRDHVAMELWLKNGSPNTLTDLRVQNCVMLGRAIGFTAQTNANKIFRAPYVACQSDPPGRWIITAWEPIFRPWANPPVPCLHADPKFPDCPPGATQRLRGRLWFYEGKDIDAELHRVDRLNWRQGAN